MQPKELGEFYEEVFQKKPDWNDGDWSGFQVGNTHVTIGQHSKAKGKSKDPVRIILNLETSEVKEEFERIKAIKGAKVIKDPYNPDEAHDMLIATFADPDGNYYQLMSPWDSGKN